MAKNSIRDFSATAGSNTDIQSVNIDENCPASGINNAIRELMVDLKNVSTGAVNLETPAADSLTVAGDLTVDTNTLHVDAANNAVGIGTTSPGFSNGSGLEVANATTACVRIEGNSAAHAVEIYADSSGGTIDARGTGAVLAFDIGGSEAARINSSGQVLIGDATPNAAGSLLELQTAQNTANVLYMLKNNQVEMTMGFKSSTDTNFYIGTGSATIGTNGVFLSNTGSSFSSVSDERRKTVIEEIENASAKVSTLRTVIGRFNHDEDDKRRPFLIAQDVQAVLPEAVSELSDEDDTLGLSYTDVIPLLTAALKESITKIETLETEMTALKARVTALEA